jgi:CHAD domain-containing protein
MERLEARLARVRERLPAALAGEEDGIHDLRVALRRCRVLARSLARERPAAAQALGELRAGATALFRAAGAVRDLDILRGEIERVETDGRLPGGIDPEVLGWLGGERRRLLASLPDAAAVFRDADEAFRSGPGLAALERGPAVAGAGARVLRRRARRLLRERRRALRKTTDDRLHRVRIRGKQLRYEAEGLAPKAELDRGLRRLQDALGSLQDAVASLRRLDQLASSGAIPPEAAGPIRAALAVERERRRAAAREALRRSDEDEPWREVKQVAGAQRHERNGGWGGDAPARVGDVELERIPGIGAAKARRLEEAGLGSAEALRAASLEDLMAVKTIGAHQARTIKAWMDGGSAPAGAEPSPAEPDGKRFERLQAVRSLAHTVGDYARTLAADLSRHEEGDAIRAGRQSERLAELLETLPEHAEAVATKRLKLLRGELREAEGLLAKVLDLDSASLKMNKLRKALKAHRKAIQGYLTS